MKHPGVIELRQRRASTLSEIMDVGGPSKVQGDLSSRGPVADDGGGCGAGGEAAADEHVARVEAHHAGADQRLGEIGAPLDLSGKIRVGNRSPAVHER